MNDELKRKFYNQLNEYVQDLKDFRSIIVNEKYGKISHEDILRILHKLAGICLTFDFKTQGHLARYAEVRFKKIFQAHDFSELKKSVSIMDDLIESCGALLRDKEVEFKAPLDSKNMRHKSNETVLKDGKPIHVLVVDDDPVLRMLMVQSFKSYALNVDALPDGIEVLQYILKEKPDFIILDENMPRMNGVAVCEQLLTYSEFKEIPIFILSAHEAERFKDFKYLTNVKSFIEKPFKIESVIEKMKSYI